MNDPGTHFLKLGGDALHVLGNHVLHQDIAAHCGDGGHVGTGLDLVRDDGVGAAGEGVDTPDLHSIRTGAGDPGTHGVQEVGQIHDVGLFGGVFNDGLTGDQAGCQHDVDGGANGGHVQADPSSLQAVAAGLQRDEFIGLIHIRTQEQKALDVLVDGPGGEVAAAGQGDLGLAEAPQQSAHQVVAGPHLPHQCGVGLGTLDIGAINFQHIALRTGNFGAHSAENV